MSTLGLETVLIGDVSDGVGDAILTDERELSTDSDSFVLGTGVPQFTLFLSGSTIAGLITVSRKNQINTKGLSLGFALKSPEKKM